MKQFQFVVTALCFALAQQAAAATYSFVAPQFDRILDQSAVAGTYTTSMRITGSLTFTSELAANTMYQGSDLAPLLSEFSFTDERQTFDQTNTDNYSFTAPASTTRISALSLETDSFGNIFDWRVEFVNPLLGFGDIGGQIDIAGPSRSGGFSVASMRACAAPNNCTSTPADSGTVGAPGVWSREPSPSEVPIPASGVLLASVLGLVLLRRKLRAV